MSEEMSDDPDPLRPDLPIPIEIDTGAERGRFGRPARRMPSGVYRADRGHVETVRWLAGVLGLFACTLDADVNDDGQVDVADVMAVAADWHNPAFTPAHDLDDDGDVDVVDVMLVAAHWGETCE